MNRLADVALGVRLAVGGGRTSAARLLLTAVGLGLGVAVLLGAAAAASAVATQNERESARSVAYVETADQAQLLWRDLFVQVGDDLVNGAELSPLGAAALPGVDRLPAAGEIVLSPALADQLAVSPHPGFPERVIGEIGPAGLSRPGELYFYAGLPPAHRSDAVPVQVGVLEASPPPDAAARLLFAAAIVALLVPIGVLVLVATRVAAASRERRMAALRLVGATRAQADRIAAGEALVGAAAGLVAGGLLFLALRPLADRVSLLDYGFFATDLVPAPGLVGLIVIGVALAAVVAAVLGQRRESAGGPLGSVRRGPPRRRRVLWRLLLVGAGAALLVLGMDGLTGPIGGLAVLLVGVVLLVPWLVERVSLAARPAGLASQLAVRRLQLDPGTATRAVAGVVVVLTAGVALQTVLTSASAYDARQVTAGQRAGATGYEISHRADPALAAGLADRLREVDGVHAVHPIRRAVAAAGTSEELYTTEGLVTVEIRECAELVAAGLRGCAPGQTFAFEAGMSPDPVVLLPQPGSRVELEGFASLLREPTGLAWTVPAYTPLPGEVFGALGLFGPGLLVAAGGPLDALDVVGFAVRADESTTLFERLQGVVAAADRAAFVYPLNGATVSDSTYVQELQRAVLAGTLVVVLLAALGQLVTAVDQTYEGRRALAALAVVGVPRRTLAAATMIQTAVPLLVGLALAVPAGLGTAVLLLAAVNRTGGAAQLPPIDLAVPWSTVGLATGVAALLVMVVSLAALPALRSVTRPDAVRFE